MRLQQKISLWNGTNKRRARSRKLAAVLRDQRSRLLPPNPQVLSFAGTQAHFERALVSRGATLPENITTIQQAGGKEGEEVLRRLLRVKDQHLPGMYVWPHTFHSFSSGCKKDRILTPPFVPKRWNPPKWYRAPTFRREMERFLDKKPTPFSVLDIDFCGVFSQTNGGDVVQLMRNGMLADKGLLFVNHQKGRDGRSGKLFEFLREYFRYCRHFDVNGLSDRDGGAMDFDSEDPLSFWFTRYVLVPVYYVCEAFEAGYRLEVERLVEYRDTNPDSGAGVVMLQWYFRFGRLRSYKLRTGGDIAEPSAALTRDRQRLQQHLEIIAREAYPYTETID